MMPILALRFLGILLPWVSLPDGYSHTCQAFLSLFKE